MRRRGFTLVEVLIALALAMMVILITASAFRLASQAISRARTMSVENRMLRLGMALAIDDLDFWRSYGDPQLPYAKGHLQEQGPGPVGIGWGKTEAPRIAPMRRVTFSRRTDLAAVDTTGYDTTARLTGGSRTQEPAHGLLTNPNVLLGHDPRSWYRGHGHLPVDPDYALEASGHRFGFSRRKDSPTTYALAFQPSQLWGPYHLLASTDMADPDHAPRPAAERRMAMTAPNLQHRLYQRLGEFGMLLYLPNGSPVLVPDRSGRAPDFDSVPTHPNQTDDREAYQLGNWIRNLSRNANRTYGSRDEAGQMDVQSWAGLFAFTHADGRTGEYNRVQALFYRPVAYDRRELVNEPYNGAHNNEYGDRAWLQDAALTIHLPYNLSKDMRATDLDYVTRPADAPILSTTSLRYAELRGGDLCLQRVMLDNVETGQLIMVGFTALGTTYRGARQHYRVAGAELGYDMGDWYE